MSYAGTEGLIHNLRNERDTLRRVVKIAARMGQSVGFAWNQMSVEARSSIMETVDGSFGLDDLIVEWATEFDRIWEEREAIIKAKDLPGGDDFPERLAEFVDTKFKTLTVEARLG